MRVAITQVATRICSNVSVLQSSPLRSSYSHKNISPNLGAWWQNEITAEIILDAISKEERKIDSYIKHSVKTQWLLLVIGGLGESSYEINKDIKIEFTTKFDKIYVLEDFKNRLYELK